MLIIPLSGKLNLRNLPFVTISLILINALIFFSTFSKDRRIFKNAMEYYQETGLLETELEAYQKYVEGEDRENPCQGLKGSRRSDYGPCIQAMVADEAFQEALKDDEIIRPESKGYESWRDGRNRYEEILSNSSSNRWGFTPDKHRPVTFLSHMFLHGGVMHLLGNMIFLWLVGCALEMAMGRGVFFGVYLATGLGAVLLFWLAYRSSSTPLVGASGAVSGLMGAFSLLFWKRKIRVFYSLGFYFNTVRVYGWILLPIWLGGELVQLIWLGAENVAYMAHIGGLLSGGMASFFYTKGLKRDVEDLFEEPPEVDETALMMEEAMDCMARLDVAGARSAFEAILAEEPLHERAAEQLFNLASNTPESPFFHETTARILFGLLSHGGALEKVDHYYRIYRERASFVKFPPELCLLLARHLLHRNCEEEARKYLFFLAKKRPTLNGLSEAWLNYATLCKRKGQEKHFFQALQVILTYMEDSSEADAVKKSYPHLVS
ncbi:MAG: rhomboid family intramembrane serine protease [Desulfobacterales bacterium]|nr:rhomboid family intramembrane serine protease [Desulfobacterales bacterium]